MKHNPTTGGLGSCLELCQSCHTGQHGVQHHGVRSVSRQQIFEAFGSYDHKHKYLILDRDAKFGEAVSDAVETIGLKAIKPSFRSPWQNGIAERWVGSCWRDLLDHVVPVNERHLKRLLSEYVRYYHDDRIIWAWKKIRFAANSNSLRGYDRKENLHSRRQSVLDTEGIRGALQQCCPHRFHSPG